jgi:hypothetical protein
MSASISDIGEEVLVGSCSFRLRSVHMALLNAPSLVIVELSSKLPTHRVGVYLVFAVESFMGRRNHT